MLLFINVFLTTILIFYAHQHVQNRNAFKQKLYDDNIEVKSSNKANEDKNPKTVVLYDSEKLKVDGVGVKTAVVSVDESLTIPIVTSHRRIGGDTLMSSTTRLSVAVSSLKLAAGGRLELTCLATIPAYKGPLGKYADSRNHSVLVDIVVEEEPEQSTTPEMLRSSDTAPRRATSIWITLLYVVSQYYYIALRLDN